MTVGFDTSILIGYYNSRAGIATAAGASTLASKLYAPTAPWALTAPKSAANTPTMMSDAVKGAMSGDKLINEDAAKLDLPGASADYKKLFALFNGLNTLSGVVDQIKAKGLTSAQQTQIKTVFNNGLSEIENYVNTLQLDKIRLTTADATSVAKTTVPITNNVSPTYATPPLIYGDVSQPAPAFQGDVKFNISIKRIGVTHDIAIDLSEMGSTPRTIANVVNYINDKLSAEGVGTRVASLRNPGGDRTVSVGGKDVKVGTNPDSWSLNFKIDSGDTVSFSAPATAPSLYIAQTVGDPDPDKDPTTKDGVTSAQLLKFQPDSSDVDPPTKGLNDTNWVDGRSWAKNMDPNVGTVHATQVASDGSVYVLADVSGKVNGQAIKGSQDVALLKYDSAGNLVFTQTLGAASSASGLALAVSADGKQVAVAGSVTGAMGGTIDGPMNSGDSGTYAGNSDSFVTVYNSEGEEQWTQRRGARLNDEADQIAFGDDGAVYVAGRSQSTMPGGSAIGGWDSYIEGFKADAKGKVSTLFTQTVGSASADKPGGLVVDGSSLVLANNEGGHAVLHRFDLSGGTPVETASRDLGDLQGGDIAGLALNGGQIVIAGSTYNGSLDGGSITSPLSGGQDGFVAQLSANLTPSGSDRLAYYGGGGNDKITGLAVSGGKVYISGQAGTDLPNADPVGKKDGFVAQMDVSAGTVAWSQRFTGTDGYAVPTTLAVDASGASVLDRLGLPKGTIDTTPSQQIAAQSSLRAGDSFQVSSSLTGVKKTVTIDNGETLESLAAKLNRAFDYQASISVQTVSGQRTLSIKPLNDRSTLQLFAGPAGKDALTGLGLPEGIVRSTTTTKDGKVVPADGKGQIYGLKFDGILTLDNATTISHVTAELASAMVVVRQAYKDLQTAATPQAVLNAQKAASATGAVPAYLTNQIANYQAALQRLTGSSS